MAGNPSTARTFARGLTTFGGALKIALGVRFFADFRKASARGAKGGLVSFLRSRVSGGIRVEPNSRFGVKSEQLRL